jgi:hypothetical protein
MTIILNLKKKMCACFFFPENLIFWNKINWIYFGSSYFSSVNSILFVSLEKNCQLFNIKKLRKKPLVVRCEVHLQTSQQWQLKAKTTSPWQHCYNIHCCGVGWFFVFFKNPELVLSFGNWRKNCKKIFFRKRGKAARLT